MRLSNWSKCVLATLIAQILWGIGGPLVKIVLTSVPPASLLFFRCLFTTLILFPVYEFYLLKHDPKFEKKDKIAIFYVGFLGVFVNIIFYFFGQRLTTVIDAWVITSLGTPFVLIYSYFALRERLAKKVYLGIILAFMGTFILIGSSIFQLGRGGLIGNILMLLATVAAAAAYIMTKPVVSKISALTITYYSFLIALIFTTPLFLWDFWQNPSWIAAVPPIHWVFIIYFIFGTSITAYWLSNYGLKHLPASIAGSIGYVSAVIAIALSIIFLHEKITLSFVLGTAIIALGLFLAETRHRIRA